MSLLVDLFGYLSIIIHALTITAQSIAIGGVIFLVFLARPQAWLVGAAGDAVLRDTLRIAAWGAVALIICEVATVGFESAVLMGTLDLPLSGVVGANFAIAGTVKIGAAVVLLLLLLAGRRAPASLLLAAGLVELAAATLTTHAAARLDDRPLLLVVEGLHQLGAAIWIGGIPCFISALMRVHEGASWRVIGERFSRMAMIGVACIVVSGATMSYFYIGSWGAAYGTAFGVMVGAKVAMFAGLLALGYGNFRTVARLRADTRAPVGRMKRFAEVELGVGISIFFAAASLTSVAPAIDLTQDRVTWPEIVERNWPVSPRLESPDHDTLALPALQAKLDAEAAVQKQKPPPAFVPGSGELP